MTNKNQISKIKCQKVLLEMLVCLVLVSGGLALAHIAHAADEDGIDVEDEAEGDGGAQGPQQPVGGVQNPLEQLDQILKQEKSGLADFAGRKHELSSVDPGADILTTVIFTALDFLKYLLATIAVGFIIISGLKMITAGTKIDEVSQKEKDNLKYIIYGLILVIIADELVTKVFFGDYGECIASASNAKECAIAGGNLTKGIYSFILAIIASIAVMVLVIAGFRMVTSAGNEEVINKEKKRITMAIIGILIAGVAEFAIKGVIFPEAGKDGIDVEAGKKLVLNFTNFVAAFIGAGSFAMLFYGGYLYVASFGNEEQTGKAKKIVLGAIIGIVIALAAYGIVTTITTFSSGREIELPRGFPGT